MTARILALDVTGNPFRWLSKEAAIYRVTNRKVAWSLGDENGFLFRGGLQNSGIQSEVHVPPIIALVRSEGMAKHMGDIPLGRSNVLLHQRDGPFARTAVKLPRNSLATILFQNPEVVRIIG